MLMGPIFRAELLRTARRGRYYVLRTGYASVLLLFFWSGYQAAFDCESTVSIAKVAQFAESTFITFAIVQLTTVLVMVPPFFAGTIADEKQRKTLHYLMASQLSGAEIVADKVLGRLPHLAVMTAIALPIVEYSGSDRRGVSRSRLPSSRSVRRRRACLRLGSRCSCRHWSAGCGRRCILAYFLIFGWMIGPAVCLLLGSTGLRVEYQWIRPVNDWLAASTPTGVLVRMMIRRTIHTASFSLSAMRRRF